MLKAFAPAFALVAAVPALWGTAPGDGIVTADLDGDGRADRISVRVAATDPTKQELTAVVRGFRISAFMPVDSTFGALPPRITDLDGDGRDEVVVNEVRGANTDHFTVWRLDARRLRPITTPDGATLRLTEGGGASAVSRYGCVDVEGRRLLVTVLGAVDRTTDPRLYDGERVTHAVVDGVATATSTTPVRAERNAPAYQVDRNACA
ncbi:hypothetical protein [Saccharothrix luteola]|uniref:hypothetical protein n=1 Tax=Saccharothrix luteola TaxID=2893018 RepID=UPI001E603FEC|nr:hypothetical protein [Saccharothrix luteola]MCC8251386.1 hypothetical protein [Saccharothrix luteola]